MHVCMEDILEIDFKTREAFHFKNKMFSSSLSKQCREPKFLVKNNYVIQYLMDTCSKSYFNPLIRSYNGWCM